MNRFNRDGSPLLVVVAAVVIVAGLSFVPWTRLTSGFFKDFDLLEDISDREVNRGDGEELVDPLLLEAMSADSVATQAAHVEAADVADSVKGTPDEAPRRDGIVLLEDYSRDGGLNRFKAALARRGTRPVRIAVIGDSYIEGDIFTQDVRELLQAEYGGRGVGYVPLASDIEGFRRSVHQSHKGWTESDIRTDKSGDCRWLSGQRFVGAAGSTATWKGTSRLPHAAAWNMATIVFRAPSSGDVTVKVGDDDERSLHVEGSDTVQSLCFSGEMSSLKFTNTSVAGMTVYGAWLNDASGVTVDAMSLRGNSGIVHTGLSTSLAAAMRPHIDYDLIVVEYGLNAMSSKQKDYTYYGRKMLTVVERLRQCYPNADILVMATGDRGQKSGSEVHSLSVVQAMVNAQRSYAREAGVVFWDTRAAMGGEDACVAWRDAKELNADYIHLNHDGGRHLADLFVKALNASIAE